MIGRRKAETKWERDELERTQYKHYSLDITHYAAHEVLQAACVLRVIRTGSRCVETTRGPSGTGCVGFLLVNRPKAVEESEAGGDVLEKICDGVPPPAGVLDDGAVSGGCEQVLTVFREMDTAYGVGVAAGVVA